MTRHTSRFDCFPSEVFAIIFEFGTFSERGKLQQSANETPFVFESSAKSNNYRYTPQFPILVSHVSRRWRQIALNTPTLWSTLYFQHASHIERGRVFLERCSPRHPIGSPEFCLGFLLDIIIATVPFKRKTQSDEISQEELQKIFDLICPVTVRWRSFYLHVRDNTCKKVARDALGRTCGRAPNLETLQLYHFEDFANVDDLIEATIREPVICFANDVPRLKNLSLIGVNLPWANSPWLEDLDTLELALHPDKIRPPYQYWDRMLRRSPNLRKLNLHYSGPKDRWEGDESQGLAYAWQGDDLWRSDLPSDRLSLENLEQLSLTDMDAPYLTRIVERIHLPNVQRLVLELSAEEEDSDYNEFLEKCIGAGMSIPESSSARLSHVSDLSNSSISALPPAYELAPPLLPFLPTLTSLTLWALDCKLSVLQSLLINLPELRELEVDFQRICVGDANPESAPAWRIFAKDAPTFLIDDEAVFDDFFESASACPTPSRLQSTPILLPKLQVFRILRLGGKQVERIIRHRECIVQSTCDNEATPSNSYTLPFSPEMIPARQKSMYIIKYTKEMIEQDSVLRELIASGCCYFRTKDYFRRWDTRFESSEMMMFEENPSAVLRRLDLHGKTAKKGERLAELPNLDLGWTKVMVQSEMINAEESVSFEDEEEEDDFEEEDNFTDDEAESDFD